jgi:2'-5' RNA ligase
MPRLFVALELPAVLREQLAAFRRGLPGARWVPEDQFHLTLAFLGEVEGPAFASVKEGLHGVRSDPFEMELAGTGRFPPRGSAKVLWVGVRDPTEVSDLAAEIRRCLDRRGLPRDARRFSPHVTLARLRSTPAHEVDTYLAASAGWVSEPYPFTDFHLYSSHLGRNGAQHRLEASYPLIPGNAH